MTERRFNVGALCAFVDDRGLHEGKILGQEGEDYAWALIYDLEEVIEVCPRHMATDDGLIIFRIYERRRTIKSVAEGPAIGSMQSPFFEGTKRHYEMLADVKCCSLLLGQ